jgi:hypothetical protein
VIKTDPILQYCGVSKRRGSMSTESEPVTKRAKMQHSPCRSYLSQNAVIPTKAVINNGPNMSGTFALRRKAAKRTETWSFAETLKVSLSLSPQGEDRPYREEPLPTTTDEAARKAATPQFAVAVPIPAADNDGANTDPVTDTRPNATAAERLTGRYRWEPEEDAKLTKAVQELGYNWVSVARMVPERTEKECCSRWIQTLRPTNGVRGKVTPTEASTRSTQDQGIMQLSESAMTIRGLLVMLAKEKNIAHGMAESIVQRIEAGVERRSVLKVNAASETVALKRQFDKLSREELLAVLRHLNVGKFEEAWKDKFGKYRLDGEPRLKTGNNAPKCEVTELLVAYLNLDSETQTLGPTTDGMKDK